MEKTVTVKETKGWISARKGIIVDIPNKKMFKGIVHHKNGKVLSIEPAEHDCNEYIMPGFLDSHIHIESSMLVPTEFAWIALKHGTVGTISDPHEIANVLGVKGVEYMINNA
jgi:adenine deaminase